MRRLTFGIFFIGMGGVGGGLFDFSSKTLKIFNILTLYYLDLNIRAQFFERWLDLTQWLIKLTSKAILPLLSISIQVPKRV